jgi:hypothetical protein
MKIPYVNEKFFFKSKNQAELMLQPDLNVDLKIKELP